MRTKLQISVVATSALALTLLAAPVADGAVSVGQSRPRPHPAVRDRQQRAERGGWPALIRDSQRGRDYGLAAQGSRGRGLAGRAPARRLSGRHRRCSTVPASGRCITRHYGRTEDARRQALSSRTLQLQSATGGSPMVMIPRTPPRGPRPLGGRLRWAPRRNAIETLTSVDALLPARRPARGSRPSSTRALRRYHAAGARRRIASTGTRDTEHRALWSRPRGRDSRHPQPPAAGLDENTTASCDSTRRAKAPRGSPGAPPTRSPESRRPPAKDVGLFGPGQKLTELIDGLEGSASAISLGLRRGSTALEVRRCDTSGVH